MRRRDRELSRAEAEDILRRGEFGVLGTCGAEGMPYAVPLSYVFEGGCIAFHCAAEGHKLQNLRENARACFTVVGGDGAAAGQVFDAL